MSAATLDPLIYEYVTRRRRAGELADDTAKNVRYHLLDFSRLHGRRPLSQLGPRSVERWVVQMRSKGHAPGTISARVTSLRVFARWCVLNRHIERDWTLAAPKVRRARRVARDITGEHVDMILAQARDSRDRLVVWLMWGCGLRCVEVARLNVDDFDRVAKVIHITGKAGHERTVPVPGPVWGAMDTYLEDAGHRAGALIRREDGTDRLHRSTIGGMVGRMIRAAGLKVRPYDGRSAHGLRGAAATDLHEACQKPWTVMEFLGHANLLSLGPYVRRATVEQVRAAQEARPFNGHTPQPHALHEVARLLDQAADLVVGAGVAADLPAARSVLAGLLTATASEPGAS